MLKEFKEFIMRGNVIDLAVAVIIGGAFGAIVNSLISDVITPLILNPALDAAGAKDIAELKWGAISYGKFLASVINFIIIAFCLFLILKGFNTAIKKMKKKDEEKSETPKGPSQEQLLTEIRDLLKNK
ncbi:MAG: large conductance mechanosensitive channel protein MscL [Flavobacteriia bacterium]|nr:large conductance mechanosensitive channel protein MscL [Flavobacteriia bacterium]